MNRLLSESLPVVLPYFSSANLCCCCCCFALTEHTFLICEEFRLDPSVAYHAIEILERRVTRQVKSIWILLHGHLNKSLVFFPQIYAEAH